MDTQERNGVVELYEPRFTSTRHANFYGHSGYSNFGYWSEDTQSGRAACDCLIDRLVGKLSQTPETILDVACGEAGTTSRIRHRYQSAEIKAINVSPHQIDRAANRYPDIEFICMDATQLNFPDKTFDLVICVEAAFHFQTREAFLREAFRVLRPGGSLLMSDLIFRRFPGSLARFIVPDFNTFPRENYIDRRQFEHQLNDIGFRDVDIENVIAQSFHPCAKRFVRFAWSEYFQPKRWPGVLLEAPPPIVALWWNVVGRYLEEELLIHAVHPTGEAK